MVEHPSGNKRDLSITQIHCQKEASSSGVTCLITCSVPTLSQRRAQPQQRPASTASQVKADPDAGTRN
ncbi:hypothetical protein AV530_005128 [Patagioenas fasciata monilis]|uniref:Uncharacterized protein n=1 Tax=Patagioenas fasciata monilis TaxID=372326 RepID=A0A1V4K427_PATFA|nr:hypothetical protein AV530_005128 [Patagioenas fasciata monilis]